MKNKEELFKRKAELLTLLAPLGFTDPDPEFLDLVHTEASVVISAIDVTPESVIQRICFIAFNQGKKYTADCVRAVI